MRSKLRTFIKIGFFAMLLLDIFGAWESSLQFLVISVGLWLVFVIEDVAYAIYAEIKQLRR